MKSLLATAILTLSACASTPTSFSEGERHPLLIEACKNQTSDAGQRDCKVADGTKDLKEGLWCCEDSSGHLVMASQFHHGQKNGRTELYAPQDGHIESISTWKNGQLEGPQINFFKNGVIANEYAVKDGHFIGELKDYDEAGRLRSLGHYKNGKRKGLYQEWNEAGVLIFEESDK